MYRVVRDRQGAVRAVWRIVWNEGRHNWYAGDGFFAHHGTGWWWCPEDFSRIRGMGWKVSGMGGADDDSEPASRDEALEILAAHGTESDSIDLGKYPTPEEQAEFERRRTNLAGP